jgi:phenylacetate-CoA ligase
MSKVYSQVLSNFLMPLANRVMHTKDMYYLKEIRKMSQWSPLGIMSWQNDKFLDLINHFHKNTRFVPKLFAEHGISLSTFKSIDDIKMFPVLNKALFLQYKDEILPDNLKLLNYKSSSTGGSSGDPLKFLLDLNSWSFTVANKIYNWEKAGYFYGDRHIALGSSSLFPNSKSWKHSTFHWLKNEFPLNGMNMSNEIMQTYVDLIKSKKIKFLYGYASALYLLASYVIKQKITINGVKGVFPTSEMLTEEFRELIFKAFKCRIMDSYGARDGGITAFEVYPANYHVGYNSYINTQGLSKDGTPKPIIITDLLNKAFPFINYELGDLITIQSSESNSEYNGQVIEKIYGRESDIIYLKNGNTITGPGFTILFRDFNVAAYQIKKINELHIQCLIQKTARYTHVEEKQIVFAIKRYIGSDCRLDMAYSETIPVGANGKIKYFIN